jgi:hypothetical protein
MKRILLLWVAFSVMATTAYGQLSHGSQYRIFSEAAPANSVYGTEPFLWDVPQDAYLSANNIAAKGADVWQFEYASGRFIRTAGGGTTACATSTNLDEASGHWKLIPDGALVGSVQYYLLQSMHSSARYMYFNPDDHKLYTKDVALPTDDTRKYYRVGFEKNEAPVLNVSTIALPFSSSFLSKDFTVSAENISADITFTVPQGISLSGTNVVSTGGNYSIPAAKGNGNNTVTITAGSDEGIAGVISVSSAGATTRNITVTSGVKQGAWYTFKLFHYTADFNLGAKDDDAAAPTLKEPVPTALDQVFTLIPVVGKNETFKIKTGRGVYLLGAADGTVSYGASTGAATEEWTLDQQNGNPNFDYFNAFTLKVGSKAANPYLGHGTSGVGVTMTCSYPRDTKGTYKLIVAEGPTSIGAPANETVWVYANAHRQIVVAGKGAAMVSVYSVTGQRIAQKVSGVSGTSVDVPAAGIYIVTVSGNGVNKTYKVVLK